MLLPSKRGNAEGGGKGGAGGGGFTAIDPLTGVRTDFAKLVTAALAVNSTLASWPCRTSGEDTTMADSPFVSGSGASKRSNNASPS